jgi:hypothetical protein
MRACPPDRTCSRHLDARPDNDGHPRPALAQSGRAAGHGRSATDAASRQIAAAGPPIGGTSGEAPPDVRGIASVRCASLTDRDPDQAARRTPHLEHPLAARRPSHPHQPRDSIENPDSHRQNARVESGVTRENITPPNFFRGGVTPWLHAANPPYAYRKKMRGGRDVVESDSTRLLGTSGSRPRTKTPYTRRAESGGRTLCGPRAGAGRPGRRKGRASAGERSNES